MISSVIPVLFLFLFLIPSLFFWALFINLSFNPFILFSSLYSLPFLFLFFLSPSHFFLPFCLQCFFNGLNYFHLDFFCLVFCLLKFSFPFPFLSLCFSFFSPPLSVLFLFLSSYHLSSIPILSHFSFLLSF